MAIRTRNIHEILIVPAYGAGGHEGWLTGATWGHVHEVDIVDSYVATLCEELERRRMRFSVMPTRKMPGIAIDDRPKHVNKNQLVIHCRAGWEERQEVRTRNSSQVVFGAHVLIKLPRILSEVLGNWGQLYTHGHEERKPSRDRHSPLLNVEDVPAVEIFPFCVNGPNIDVYAKRYRELGHDIAWGLQEFLGDQVCTGKPAGRLEQVTKKDVNYLPDTGLPAWLFSEQMFDIDYELNTMKVKSPDDKPTPGRKPKTKP